MGREKVTDAGRQAEAAARKRPRWWGGEGLRGKIRARKEDMIEREMNERAR